MGFIAVAKQNHLEVLKKGVEHWNEWRREHPECVPALDGADLYGVYLGRANLNRASLRSANLQNADLSFCDLRDADLRNSLLQGASFQGADLSGANLLLADLRGANLEVADLSGVKGLEPGQLPAANLSGTILPQEVARFDGLAIVERISANVRRLFALVLFACAFCWLIITATTDAILLTNAPTSLFPGVEIPIPVVTFYTYAPVVLLCLYLLFHLQTLHLWSAQANLPTFLPDGTLLTKKGYPSLLRDLFGSFTDLAMTDRPYLSPIQAFLSNFFAWWALPITLFVFWFRFLYRHDLAVTRLHVVLFIFGSVLMLALRPLWEAKRVGVERQFLWRAISGGATFRVVAVRVLVALFALLMLWRLSAAAIEGAPDGFFSRRWAASFITTDVSGKPEHHAWRKQDERALLQFVKGANLKAANLRYVRALGAFLAKANLEHADLRGADLVGSDLQSANLRWAFLEGASLWNADLQGANLQGANLKNATMAGADLRGADFRWAQGLNTAQIKAAEHWDMALYSGDFLEDLDLPADNNQWVETILQSGGSETGKLKAENNGERNSEAEISQTGK